MSRADNRAAVSGATPLHRQRGLAVPRRLPASILWYPAHPASSRGVEIVIEAIWVMIDLCTRPGSELPGTKAELQLGARDELAAPPQPARVDLVTSGNSRCPASRARGTILPPRLIHFGAPRLRRPARATLFSNSLTKWRRVRHRHDEPLGSPQRPSL